MKISELTDFFSHYYWLVDLEAPDSCAPILPVEIRDGSLDYLAIGSEETEHLYLEEWEQHRVFLISQPTIEK